MPETKIKTAMVLAAGFGKRLRPLTNTLPKPLVPVSGRTMLDRTLDMLAQSKINKAIVNMHYLGAQIEAHCKKRIDIQCIISDERDQILETGGGTVKALPLLGQNPFVLVNADTFWIDFDTPTIQRMIERFDLSKMDILLLLCRMEDATGHSGGYDFIKDDNDRLMRASHDATEGFIYAGGAIFNPETFNNAPSGGHSLNIYFDRAIEKQRLYGLVLEKGHWFTVGTPKALYDAEEKISKLAIKQMD